VQLLLLCFVGVKSNVKYSALEEVGNETQKAHGELQRTAGKLERGTDRAGTGARGRGKDCAYNHGSRMKQLLPPTRFSIELILVAASTEGRRASHQHVTPTLCWEASTHLSLLSITSPTQSIASHRWSVSRTTAPRAPDLPLLSSREHGFLSWDP